MSASVLAIGLGEIEQAAQLIHRTVSPTPQYPWPKLRARTGCTLWVKHENHTPTGAFKVRGGLLYLDRLLRAMPDVRGIVSATRGNHGQSISFAAARAGVAATIYVPRGNSPDQNSAMAAFGATVIEFGTDFDEAKHQAQRAAAAQSLHLVPSFHRDLVVGVASYALELFRAAPALDTVYVGVGMGSGICSLITVRDLLGLSTEIVGVGAVGALLHHDQAVAIRHAHLPEVVIARAEECALRDTTMRPYNDRLHVEQEHLFTDPGMVPHLELPGKMHVHPRFDVHVRADPGAE